VDLDQDAVDEVVASLEEPGRHISIASDLADLAAHEPLLSRAMEGLGRLDVLAHVAAVLRRRGTISEVTEDDWDAQLDTNLKAAFFLNRAAARLMREQGRGGRIINFTSQGWLTGGFGGSVVYAASKGGIVSMSRGLARSFAGDGILVNTVAPGAVDTQMMKGLSEEDLQAFVSQIPLGRLAQPEEIAGAVVFLASDHAGYITGATINLSGGQIMY
jgi:NAD(P)-dependent dehydrogenase (short-subunit alcohol dehydrogenase family)